MKKRKIDLFNFLYSFGAVIILLGVIAKFLEWKSQDILLLTGLGVEAFVFLFSSVQFQSNRTQYQWEKIFPELVDGTDQEQSVQAITENLKGITDRYQHLVHTYTNEFEQINTLLIKDADQYHTSLTLLLENMRGMHEVYGDVTKKFAYIADSMTDLNQLSTTITSLQTHLKEMDATAVHSNADLDRFKNNMGEINSSLNKFNVLASGILNQFKEISYK